MWLQLGSACVPRACRRWASCGCTTALPSRFTAAAWLAGHTPSPHPCLRWLKATPAGAWRVSRPCLPRPAQELDAEGRVLVTNHGGLVIFNIYGGRVLSGGAKR